MGGRMTRADRAAIREAQRVDILDALAESPGMTLSETARAIGLYRQTVSRLLLELIDRGDIARRYHSRAWSGAATPTEASAHLHIPLRRLAEVRSIQRRYYLLAARPSRSPTPSPTPSGPLLWRVVHRRRGGLGSSALRIAAIRADAVDRVAPLADDLDLGDPAPLPTEALLSSLEWSHPLTTPGHRHLRSGAVMLFRADGSGTSITIDARLAPLLALGACVQADGPLDPVRVADASGPVAYLAVCRLRSV